MSSKGEATRDRILDVAFRLAAREGVEGLSLGDLAKQLDMSKSGLFAHFQSKEELQIELLRTGAARFVASVMLPAFQKPRGLPRLRALLDNWIRWATAPELPGGCLMMAASVELDDREGPVRDVLVEFQRDFVTSLARTVRIAVDEGHLRRGIDVEQLAFELYGIVLSYNHARRLLRDPKAERRAREAFARLLKAAAPTTV